MAAPARCFVLVNEDSATPRYFIRLGLGIFWECGPRAQAREFRSRAEAARVMQQAGKQRQGWRVLACAPEPPKARPSKAVDAAALAALPDADEATRRATDGLIFGEGIRGVLRDMRREKGGRCIRCNTDYTEATPCQCGARASLRSKGGR